MKAKTAVVIGGGPAGTSAALGLLKSGFKVTLLEQRKIWTGRVCGSFLNPEAVNHLGWLGVLEEILKSGAVNVRSTIVASGLQSSTDVKTVQGDSVSLAIPRQLLEEILLEKVSQEKGTVIQGARALSFRKDDDSSQWVTTYSTSTVQLENEHSSLIVLAGGRFSLGAYTPNKPLSGWYGWNASFNNVAQNPGEQSLHFYPKGYVGVVTYSNGESNVCGLYFKKEGEHTPWNDIYEEALRAQPTLKKILNSAEQTSQWQGVGPLPFSLKMRASHGPVLVGDAAAVGDPFMGEGNGRALGAGPMIFQALKNQGENHFNPEGLLPLYEELWKKNYSSRLKMGNWTRNMMARGFLSRSFFGLLLHQSWLLRKLTPHFHVGFKIPIEKN